MSASAPTIAPKASSADIPWNPKVRQHKQPVDWVVDILIAAILIAVVFITIYPLWFIVIASFSNAGLVSQGEVTLLPKGINFSGYVKVMQEPRIWIGYRNTILYSVVGTLVNMIVTLPVGFAMSRAEFKPRRIILFLFTFTMFFSGGLIPGYLLFKDLGILNTMWVFILPGAVSVYNVIIVRSFFESSIPEELHDAAQIDGLGYFRYFMKIVLPLSSAIIGVIALYYFVGHWNDYFTGLIYIRDQNKQPLQVILQNILLANQITTSGGGSSNGQSMIERQQLADSIKYGIIIVSTLPLLVIYPFLQKYFTKGVMIGAVKG
ncbi:carbohydrate ABC transporter permease [Bifidobacterium amazonense]|uniref:Carbohydrate ABC transporter permease n=1 Tax=Bifidobacterium amazonense TaxID=2809027 RepID=A0ABS9VRS3_9BIFI|nr:carbohydrate ABC transporter permease [Bifidobacterium amazonense]MCH9274810.1 carbohydrate ABC transporter permease [Bifidobacterium amazonense]